MYQILRLKLVWEVASGWVTSFRAQRTRSNDAQMPPMTYADSITFIGYHHILGCQCKSDVLKGHVVPLTRLKPSNSNRYNPWRAGATSDAIQVFRIVLIELNWPKSRQNHWHSRQFFKKKVLFKLLYVQKTARSANIYEGPSWPGFTKG